MRVRAIPAAASALLVATLSLTACEGNKDDNAGSQKPASSASATSKGNQGKDNGGSGSGNGDNGGSSSGGGSATGGDTGGDGTGEDAPGACTSENTEAAFFTGVPGSGQGGGKAQAIVRITNTSDKTCTIVGPTTLSASDQNGGPEAVNVDNGVDGGGEGLDVPPGDPVAAMVEYWDSGDDGRGGTECPWEASEVGIALPDDDSRTVPVQEGAEGMEPEAGVFTVCNVDEVTFEEFASAPAE
ncbi:DUF4232 domain-containing protein [Streptomyces sp. NPDC047108]|uniref:DUF4232 domain-containing protein n=1 Tax=Streptomyces sp. NPDC047108 TaxID=3155025 RepID=UPI0033D57A1E